ncbi:MAG: ATP-binding cassette domain-containing protein [Herbiconiux sp.]|nr:MAG: ATP-binding cassette domain-containing protein [Herbiconiux sp.]
MAETQPAPFPPEPPRSEPAGIVVHDVGRSFGAVAAVRSVTFEARPGSITALIGPNGAGKTTLIMMLATLLRPDRGSIRIGGIDPVAEPARVRGAHHPPLEPRALRARRARHRRGVSRRRCHGLAGSGVTRPGSLAAVAGDGGRRPRARPGAPVDRGAARTHRRRQSGLHRGDGRRGGCRRGAVGAGVRVSWFAPASGELERTLQGLGRGDVR